MKKYRLRVKRKRGKDMSTVALEKSELELQTHLDKMKDYAQNIASSSESSNSFLKDIGVFDENGELMEHYKNVFQTK